jgi:hypothetical protein
MPPKKRVSKKAAAAAAANAEAPIVAATYELGESEAGTSEYVPATDIPETTEPVVLQLTIPNDRMTEIVNTASHVCQESAEPEPYNPMESFATTENQLVSGGGAHNMVCFWCCHPIVDKEFGMPIRYDSIHNSFTLYGCFCSLECTAAHNFSVHMGSDRAWEIHSWIQLLARRYGYAGRVRPAPSKFLLKMFNGPLSIEEFRAAHKGLTRTFIMNIPPFIHVASQMEVLNTSFLVK